MLKNFFLLLSLFLISFDFYSQINDSQINSFLTDNNNKNIVIYNNYNGKSIKYIIKDTLEDNFFSTQILRKKGKRFETIINSIYNIKLKVDKGWIQIGNLSVGLRSTNFERTVPIYNSPNINSYFFLISSPESIIGTVLDILQKEKNQTWLKVTFVYEGKKRIGWLSPENQCYNLYTLCTGE